MKQDLKRCICFASGTGSLFEHVVKESKSLELPIIFTTLITDQPECGASKMAQDHSIPVVSFTEWSKSKRAHTCETISELMERLNPQIILLLGFMKILDPTFVKKWKSITYNTHPSLLPAFRGNKAVQAALNAKATLTGATLHKITQDVDAGEIISQREVKILKTDTETTLHERIKCVEKTQLIQFLEKWVKQP
jgi:phosphoribosylglycinamide formyltransferase 1